MSYGVTRSVLSQIAAALLLVVVIGAWGGEGRDTRAVGASRSTVSGLRPGPRMESRSSSRSTLADLRRASSTSTATCSRDCRATFSLTRGLRAAVNSPCCRRRRSRSFSDAARQRFEQSETPASSADRRSAGGSQRTLDLLDRHDEQADSADWVTNVAWSPDGTKLACVVFHSPRGADFCDFRAVLALVAVPAHARPDSDTQPYAGPDPRLVLFVLRIGNVPGVRDGYIRLSTSGHGWVVGGSTVRVRQRTSGFSLVSWPFRCPSAQRLMLPTSTQRPRRGR